MLSVLIVFKLRWRGGERESERGGSFIWMNRWPERKKTRRKTDLLTGGVVVVVAVGIVWY